MRTFDLWPGILIRTDSRRRKAQNGVTKRTEERSSSALGSTVTSSSQSSTPGLQLVEGTAPEPAPMTPNPPRTRHCPCLARCAWPGYWRRTLGSVGRETHTCPRGQHCGVAGKCPPAFQTTCARCKESKRKELRNISVRERANRKRRIARVVDE